jgi:hypothetical protein
MVLSFSKPILHSATGIELCLFAPHSRRSAGNCRSAIAYPPHPCRAIERAVQQRLEAGEKMKPVHAHSRGLDVDMAIRGPSLYRHTSPNALKEPQESAATFEASDPGIGHRAPGYPAR